MHCPCYLTKECLMEIAQEDSHCYRSLKAERYIAYSSFTMVVFSETYTPSKNFRMSFFLTWHDMLISAADLLTSSMSLPEITSSSLTFVDRTILTPETCQHRLQLAYFILLAHLRTIVSMLFDQQGLLQTFWSAMLITII